MNTYYCGLDVSNKSIVFCIVDEKGEVLRRDVTTVTTAGLRDAFRNLPKKDELRCVTEAGPLAESVCLMIEELGHAIAILDPRRAKAVTATRRKTDRLDAEMLAQLCRTNWFTKVHRKSGHARNMRSYLTARMLLVRTKGTFVSAIRGILRAHGIVVPAGRGELFEEFIRETLKKVEPMLREAIQPLFMIYQELCEREIKMTNKLRRRYVVQNDAIRRMMTIPGVGPIVASAFVATIDTPDRFRTGNQVACYLGLVPRIYQSGEMELRGRITRQGDELLRWLLIEAATVLLSVSKQEIPLREWGLKLQEAKGFGKARVAVARKLACLMFTLWKRKEDFDPQRLKCKQEELQAVA